MKTYRMQVKHRARTVAEGLVSLRNPSDHGEARAAASALCSDAHRDLPGGAVIKVLTDAKWPRTLAEHRA